MSGDLYLWSMTVLAFLMSFSIGSNETDALATAYSSGAMTLLQCVRLYYLFLINNLAFMGVCSAVPWFFLLF